MPLSTQFSFNPSYFSAFSLRSIRSGFEVSPTAKLQWTRMSWCQSHIAALVLFAGTATLLAAGQRGDVNGTISTARAQCPPGQPAISQSTTTQPDLHCDNLEPGDIRRWTIKRPEVRQRLTEYPEIVFYPGESVLISARGCVNVKGEGKRGNDWRRYVDPEGTDTDRSFHGTVWVPGARIARDGQLLVTPAGTAPVRISSISGSKDDSSNSALLVLPKPSDPVKATLRLGYEVGADRPDLKHPSYPTDPYGGDPPQTGQCGVPDTKDAHDKVDAVVVVTIIPNDLGVGARPIRSLLAFDPVATEPDPNGFMLGPRWFRNYQQGSDLTDLEAGKECDNFPYKRWMLVNRGIKSSCTQQASFDEPTRFGECAFGPAFGQFHGHVNWVPSTFIGKLTLKDYSADHDLDLQLRTLTDLDRAQRFLPGNKTGTVSWILTKDSQRHSEYKDVLWLEFADYETIEHFPDDHCPNDKDNVGGWHSLLTCKEPHSMSKEQPIIDRTAVVTGLLNLDCVHECHTELHPVLAMAVRLKSENDVQKDNDDRWMIFVRNHGNEGDCSLDQHYLDRNVYTMLLPAPAGAMGAIPVLGTDGTPFTSNIQDLTWSMKPSLDPPGALVTFSLVRSTCSHVRSGKMVRISGVLHLNWLSSEIRKLPTCPLEITNDNPKRDSYPVCWQESPRACPPEPFEQGYAEEYLQEQKNLNQDRRKPNLIQGIGGTLADYHGKEIGAFEEVLLYNGSTQIQPNLALRGAILQTPLGNVEIDASLPFVSRQVKSTNGTSLQVKANDYLAGLKLEVEHRLRLYVELKGGEIVRSASSGFLQTPDFKHFTGHNGAILIGGGINPGRQEGKGLSLRLSVGALFIPSTGEKMFRLALGPQYSF
jgi:hypothetical protein